MTPDSIDLRRRLDDMPISRLHVAVICLCSLAFAFDLLEIALGGALSAIFSVTSDPANRSALPWLLASVYIGAVMGAPIFGRAADRYGRQPALVAALVMLALCSIGEAASPDVWWLAGWRTASGLALGAYPPLVIAYLTELLPARQRGRLILLVSGIACLGAPAGIFLVRALTPIKPLGIDGWRWAFLLGSIGSATCAIGFARLPESPVWLASRRQFDRALRNCDRLACFPRIALAPSVTQREDAPLHAHASVAPPAPSGDRRGMVMFSLLSFLCPWSNVAFPLLSGALLMQKGLGLQNSLLLVGLAMFGPALSAPLCLVIDRLPRRLVLGACSLAMVGLAALFISSDIPAVLVVTGALFTFTAAVVVPVMNIYGAELFTTRTRGSRISTAWMFNRIGAVLAPLALVPVLHVAGGSLLFAAIAATLVASAGLLAFSPRGRAQLPVD